MLKPLGPAAWFVRTLLNELVSGMLWSQALTTAMNVAYERLGPRYDDLFNRIVRQPRITRSFAWKGRFLDKTFCVPVDPRHAPAWENACYWRKANNRSIRRYYEFFLRRSTPGWFLDIGANDGLHTYPFAAHGYQCLCFEPQPVCLDYIAETCRLNGFHNVRAVPCVLSNEDQSEVEFYFAKSSVHSSLIRNHATTFGETVEVTQVRSVRLDDFLQTEAPIVVPTLIKIDVEEAEWLVLQGGRNVIAKHRPDLLVEISRSTDKEPIWEFLQAHEYRAWGVQMDDDRPFVRIMSLNEFVGDPNPRWLDYVFRHAPGDLIDHRAKHYR